MTGLIYALDTVFFVVVVFSLLIMIQVHKIILYGLCHAEWNVTNYCSPRPSYYLKSSYKNWKSLIVRLHLTQVS